MSERFSDKAINRLAEHHDDVYLVDDEMIADLAREIRVLRRIAEAADAYHDVACDPKWCELCSSIIAWRRSRFAP